MPDNQTLRTACRSSQEASQGRAKIHPPLPGGCCIVLSPMVDNHDQARLPLKRKLIDTIATFFSPALEHLPLSVDPLQTMV